MLKWPSDDHPSDDEDPEQGRRKSVQDLAALQDLPWRKLQEHPWRELQELQDLPWREPIAAG
jgi:hypothetical protein